ncbi:glycoside hydrolase family 28 protein [Prevotella sp. AGR2160]|uniref:rhamnogalacturonidase n=1 Tax=Prevotella sp. AGR2160 TaxID=1280674 RepID=UPI0003F4EEB8|nr:glycosyl hydrolase family 28 protein [Prevotella sp. AGR2160]
MKKTLFLLLLLLPLSLQARKAKQLWPDGTPIDVWFNDTSRVDTAKLGPQYVITNYGVKTDSTLMQTAAIQHVIDLAASRGGGLIVVPRGTFLSGALFFKPGTSLYITENGVLKGSDRVEDFPIIPTARVEGQTCKYFSAFINADGVDGFTICGRGTINGNGYHYWKEFWLRRAWNPKCTNKDAQRPKLVYIQHSKNVTVQDVKLINSPFWTNYLYRCHHVRYLGCTIYAPTEGVKAPSSDAIDIDNCHDVLVNGCYMNVNDDAVVLKGGKGTWADKDSTNGPNSNVIIQNCHYGRVMGCLTLGSESIYDRNIILRNCHTDAANRVLWLKMRPDTPQHYEFVTVENITGYADKVLVVRPWTQFYKLEDRTDMPLSQCNNITIKGLRMKAGRYLDVGRSDKYRLTQFTFADNQVEEPNNTFDATLFE